MKNTEPNKSKMTESATASELKPLLCKQKIKVLNLYAGIGGNRKLWDNVEVVAVEWDKRTAEIYQDYFPDDDVIVGDAHQYLLDHYNEFDFIWSSPPCPTHSKLRYMQDVKIYPDMALYAEIIFLQTWAKCKWLVENVEPYYTPLIAPTKNMHRHLFWSNFKIGAIDVDQLQTCKKEDERAFLEEEFGYDLSPYSGIDKRKALRNCVVPELGKHILDRVRGIEESEQIEQGTLFA